MESDLVANNPQLQHQMQQQHLIQRQQQAARQALMAQQYSGMPVLPNGMSPMNAAQFAAMRGNPMARPVNLPQHLQQAQQQAQHTLEQQQAQAQHQVSKYSLPPSSSPWGFRHCNPVHSNFS